MLGGVALPQEIYIRSQEVLLEPVSGSAGGGRDQECLTSAWASLPALTLSGKEGPYFHYTCPSYVIIVTSSTWDCLWRQHGNFSSFIMWQHILMRSSGFR